MHIGLHTWPFRPSPSFSLLVFVLFASRGDWSLGRRFSPPIAEHRRVLSDFSFIFLYFINHFSLFYAHIFMDSR